MRVRIEQSRSGFTGLGEAGERDLADLTPAQREALDRLLASPPPPPPGRGNVPSYTVTVTNGAPREIRVGEPDMPEVLREIIEPIL